MSISTRASYRAREKFADRTIMAFVVTPQFRSLWPPTTRHDLGLCAVHVSDPSVGRNTLVCSFPQSHFIGATNNNSIFSFGGSHSVTPKTSLILNSRPHKYAMEPLSREELERFQKLSNDYEPEVQVWRVLRVLVRWLACNCLTNLSQGPLVSQKQSSQIISAEYANADPAFVTKTNVRILIFRRGSVI